MARDIFSQISPSQGRLIDENNTANNWITGITSDFRTYNPSSAKYAAVATTRAGLVDPQRGISNYYGAGRYSNVSHQLANNSSASGANVNRISYLAPSASRPNVYWLGQDYQYSDPIKATFSNQAADGFNFYRLSDGNKVVLDQFKNANYHWLWYNYSVLDNNLLTISNSGAVSKIETMTSNLDNTSNPITPLLFQTHGGIGANNGGAMVTDYARDSFMIADDRDTYIIYRPSFGSNVQIPSNVELQGEWYSNWNGGRSGSKRKKK